MKRNIRRRRSTSSFLFIILFIMIMSVNVFAQTGALTNISLTPASNQAGETGIHTVSFTTVSSIPPDGRIVITYSSAFNINGASLATSATMDGSFTLSTSGTDIIIQRTGGTATTAGAGESINIANIRNAETAASYTVTVETQDNSATAIDEGTSDPFTIVHGPLSAFSFAPVSSPQIAGNPINLTITAQDGFGNTVADFTGTATLADQTGTISPAVTGSFSGGVRSESVVITKTRNSNSITAASGGHAGVSSAFNVNPADIDHFVFDAIDSPQTAGTPFSILITAYDQFDNVKTDFSGTVTLSDNSGTVSVVSTGSSVTDGFTNGVWNGDVIITQSQANNRLAADGTARSTYFNVVASTADHFVVSTISDQTAGEPFLITVTARDAYNNTADSFSGTVDISDLSGSVSPTTSGSFTQGVWTGNLRINNIYDENRIDVSDGSGNTGQSNPFDVITTTVNDFQMSTISSHTAGTSFSVTITARDVHNNPVSIPGTTINLHDETGSISPRQITFNGHTWTGNLTITKSQQNNRLTVTGLGKTSESNQFNVNPGAIDRYEVAEIESPRTAGTGFSITVTAKDQHGNTVTGFNGSADLSLNPAGSLQRTNVPFTAGVLNETIHINTARNDIAIIVNEGGAETGASNRFNVVHGQLSSFRIDPPGYQAAGLPFAINVTAVDAFGNTVRTFESSVDITHTGSGPITPDTSKNFIQGVWIGNVTISQTQTNDRIRVTRTGGAEAGLSDTFNVSHSDVDHFVISSISGTQTAGNNFSITITARDAENNTVTGFSGTINIKDETGTISRNQVTLSNGIWNGNVNITKSGAGNYLTVSGVGKSGMSNEFIVIPASANSLSFSLIPSPRIAGTNFPVTITAKDEYGNTATGFSGNANLNIQNGTGTITPAVVPLSSGEWSGNLSINRAQNDITIRADAGAGRTGESNLFNIRHAALNRFAVELDVAGNQIAGDPFTIHVTALDGFNNIHADFSGTVDLTADFGSVNPAVSGSFSNGRWTGNVTVNESGSGNRITVTRTGGTESGISESFNLISPPGIRSVHSQTSTGHVTAGQDSVWDIAFAFENLSSHAAELQSIQVRFLLSGAEQGDYDIQLPAIFQNSQNNIIAGQAIDTLIVRVNQTGQGTGNVHIQAVANLIDSNTGKNISAESSTGIIVQEPARLMVSNMIPSQDNVSRGQTAVWTLTAVLQNQGGSTLAIEPENLENALAFSSGTGWEFTSAQELAGGGLELAGGASDSLHFQITQTGNTPGQCTVNLSITAVELNSDRQVLSEYVSGFEGAAIFVQTPADLHVTGIRPLIPNLNPPSVNTLQSFLVRVYVENYGQERVNNLTVYLSNQGGFSTSPQNFEANITVLEGGGLDSTDILIVAPGSNALPASGVRIENFTAQVAGAAENTGQNVSGSERSMEITIRRPANLVVPRILPTRSQVIAGQVDPWIIKAAVSNTGGAAIRLDEPAANDMGFYSGAIRQVDYIVEAPAELKGGGLELASGRIDTLEYTVRSTGHLGGNIQIRPQITGIDINDESAVEDEFPAAANIQVESKTAFRIIMTYVKTVNRSEAGNGRVNTGQEFGIVVWVENGLAESINNIRVRVEKSGNSVLGNQESLIPILRPSARDSLLFRVTADHSVNMDGEIFASSIIAGVLQSGNAAPVGPALDNTATIYIDNPADVDLNLSLSRESGVFSHGQIFTLTASLVNQGSSVLYGEGELEIELPEGYSLASGNAAIALSYPNTAIWEIQADAPHENQRMIRVNINQPPFDANTGLRAAVANTFSHIGVRTVAALLSGEVFISEPAGARNNILSTEQMFTLRMMVESEHVTDIRAVLQLPFGYDTSDNLEKIVSGPDVRWQIQAPADAVPERTVNVELSGKDEHIPDNEISGETNSISIRTIRKADIELSLSASHNSVSLGQRFTVTATVTNLGQAGLIGNTQITLKPLPSLYTTSEPMIKTTQTGQVSWEITAPSQPMREAVNIEAEISGIPWDENTGKAAHISRKSSSIAVTTVGSWLSVMTAPAPDSHSNILMPGQNDVWLGTLILNNRGEQGANGIRINGLSFIVENADGTEILPSGTFTRLRAVRGVQTENGIVEDINTIYGRTPEGAIPENNPVHINFSSRPLIAAQDTAFIIILGDISDDVEQSVIQLNFSSSESFKAEDEFSAESEIIVLDNTGNPFSSIRFQPKQIYGSDVTGEDAKPYLITCPNPFGTSGEPETVFVYFLKEPARVTFRIFTLTGELVWSRTYEASDTQGAEGFHEKGINQVSWDGRNNMGRHVLNGVYIAYMETDYGERAMTKIAYVK